MKTLNHIMYGDIDSDQIHGENTKIFYGLKTSFGPIVVE